jgi:hypothetical protein
MQKILLLLLLSPALAYSQLNNTLLAYKSIPPSEAVSLHLYQLNKEADDIRRAKNTIIFGTVLNVTGAALAILAPKLADDTQTINTYKYVGIGIGVTGFAFSIPAIFVLSKNRNKYY